MLAAFPRGSLSLSKVNGLQVLRADRNVPEMLPVNPPFSKQAPGHPAEEVLAGLSGKKRREILSEPQPLPH